MKRILMATVIAVTVVAAAAVGTAWGASGPSSAIISFDDIAQQATLQIPDPPCPVDPPADPAVSPAASPAADPATSAAASPAVSPAADPATSAAASPAVSPPADPATGPAASPAVSPPACVWKFFLNEPKLSVDVATVFGTQGTLTLDYPPNFCGVIQADAYVGPSENGPWVAKRGWQHTINDCTTPTPTPPSAPTYVPPAGGPPTAAGSSGTPPSDAPEPASAAVAPAVAAASVTPTTVATAPAKTNATLTSLPFTGADLEPLVYLGLTLVTLGLCLLVRRRSRTL